MDEKGNFFVRELELYLAESGKSLPERIRKILASPRCGLSVDDEGIRDDLILPAGTAIGHILRERLERPGVDRNIWESEYLAHYRTVVGGIVSDVLAEAELPGSGSAAMSRTRGPLTVPGRSDGEALERLVGGGPEPPPRGEAAGEEQERPAPEGEGDGGPETPGPAGETALRKRGKNSETAVRMAKALGWLATICLVLVLFLASFLMVAPRFGIQAYSVLSGSMEPTLRVGGMTICRSVPKEEIEIGDIIVFNNPEGEMVTHRVVDVEVEEGNTCYQTKGDANEDPDPDRVTIVGDKVDKVIYHLPYLGFFSNFMRTRLAFTVFLCVPALILFVLFGRDMRRAIAEVRDKKRAQAHDADKPRARAAQKG